LKHICLNPKCQRKFIHPVILHKALNNHSITNPDILDEHICPYCQTLDIDEYVEPKADISSMIDVNPNEVDAKLAEGYEVFNADWQKGVRMIKHKQPQGDHIDDILQAKGAAQ
jgi:hypothetical protein